MQLCPRGTIYDEENKKKKGENEESKGGKKKIYHDQDTVYEDVLPSIPVIIANGRCNSFWLNVDVRPVANGGRLRQTNVTLAQFRVVNDVEASRRGTDARVWTRQ